MALSSKPHQPIISNLICVFVLYLIDFLFLLSDILYLIPQAYFFISVKMSDLFFASLDFTHSISLLSADLNFCHGSWLLIEMAFITVAIIIMAAPMQSLGWATGGHRGVKRLDVLSRARVVPVWWGGDYPNKRLREHLQTSFQPHSKKWFFYYFFCLFTEMQRAQREIPKKSLNI